MRFLAASIIFASLLSPQQHPVVNLDTHPGLDMPSGMDMATQQLIQPNAAVVSGTAVPVLTRSGGNLRHGVYQDTVLTPASIVKTPPHKIGSILLPGDDRLEAQPLVAKSITMANGEVHDLIVTATMGNQIYYHDFNDLSPLQMTRLGNPIQGTTAIDGWMVNQHWGILSTPVIGGNYLYVVAWISPNGTAASAAHWFFKVDLRSGQIANKLQLTKPGAIQRKQRASLTLFSHYVFIPWGTIQETATGAHGFITAIDLNTFTVTDELSLTATGSGAGIWMAGQGLSVDANGIMYGMTGNGSYDGVSNFGESFIKVQFVNNKLSVISHYSPFLDADRGGAWSDMDLGSGGAILMPDLGIIAGAGKDGILYTLDENTFALKQPPVWYTFFPGFGIPANPANVKDLNVNYNNESHHMHSTSVYWNGKLYAFGENGNLRAWSIDGTGKVNYLGRSTEEASPYAPVPPGGMPGAFMALSSNGNSNGLIWAIIPDGDANRTVTTGRVFCFNADPATWSTVKLPDGDTQITRLWMSDPHHTFSKFLPPVISGGKIIIGTYGGTVDVYGQ